MQQDTWDTVDLKEQVIITSTISDNQLEFIKNCELALDMMNTLKKLMHKNLHICKLCLEQN